MPTKLIITVDTEEEGLWGGTYRSSGNTVENIQFIAPFQDLCHEFGVRPTYLIDAPVATDVQATRVLGQIHDAGQCELGTHIHPWCNPPHSVPHDQETYLCNLPEDLQHEKIDWLTKTIEQRFGTRPVSFRAGRYGLDIVGYRILEDLGYRVDSSVIPFTDYSAQGGPNFSGAPVHPYFPADDNLCRPGSERSLLEVPVTVGYSRGSFESGYRLQQRLNSPVSRLFHLEGVLNRIGMFNRIKLSPEQSTARDMCLLLDRCIELQLPAAVMMFHSSSLMPGASPYTPDQNGLHVILNRIRRLLSHALNVRQIEVQTLAEFGREFTAISSTSLTAREGVA